MINVNNVKKIKLKYLKIEENKISQLLNTKDFWNIPLKIFQENHFIEQSETGLRYFLILSALNFCFWHKEKKKKFKYKTFSGYLALSTLLKDLIQKEKGFFDWGTIKKLNLKNFKKYLNITNTNQLLLLKERLKILKKVSDFFKNKQVYKFLKENNFDALEIINKLKKIYGFDDVFFLENKKLEFLKKAQIFVNDINLFLNLKIKNLNHLTCFPDYKLPQVFHHFGIIAYKDSLLKKIQKRQLIKKGSREEIEIRLATILITEKIKEILKKEKIQMSSVEIDNRIWNLSKKTKLSFPHHLTKTIYY